MDLMGVLVVQTTVDGRNFAPVDMVNIPLVAGSHTCYMLVGAGFLPSTVLSENDQGVQSPPKRTSRNEGHVCYFVETKLNDANKSITEPQIIPSQSLT